MKLPGLKFGVIVAMLLSFLAASAYDFKVDGIYYTKLSDGYSVYVVNKSSNAYATSTYSGDVVMPASVSYNGLTYDVTGIGSFAFYKSTVVSVSMPESVESIQSHAFLFNSFAVSLKA